MIYRVGLVAERLKRQCSNRSYLAKSDFSICVLSPGPTNQTFVVNFNIKIMKYKAEFIKKIKYENSDLLNYLFKVYGNHGMIFYQKTIIIIHELMASKACGDYIGLILQCDTAS
ncbi:hypothetical protein NQ317_007124 [Molorchus minor]|uniref:Uncharacterized protein n=1 Tax=Molorchus minor TaxID=1323400 RepID=A0ABQ9JYY7_9CUCU|nr:hypothetical protein NQ317_007124 [Molorchus minor]